MALTLGSIQLPGLRNGNQQVGDEMSILSFLNPLSHITNALTSAYKLRLNAANDADRIKAEQDIAFWEQRADVVKATVNEPWFSPRMIMGWSVAIYVFKIIVYDTVFGLGVTYYPGEHVTFIVMTVIGFYFVSRGAETIATAIAGTLAKRK